MYNLFNEEFKNSCRQKKFHYFGGVIPVEYSWYEYTKLISTHMKDMLKFNDAKQRVDLIQLHQRESIPSFAKNILNELNKTFNKNTASLIAFSGWDNHQSFDIHKDTMDVLYLQVIGNITWQIWESDSPKKDLNPEEDEATMVWEKNMSPGDLIWIPRGVYHKVNPHGPRVGFSFGVENKSKLTEVNPAWYI